MISRKQSFTWERRMRRFLGFCSSFIRNITRRMTLQKLWLMLLFVKGVKSVIEDRPNFQADVSSEIFSKNYSNGDPNQTTPSPPRPSLFPDVVTEELSLEIASLSWQALENRMHNDSQFLLIRQNNKCPLTFPIIRYSSQLMYSLVVVDIGDLHRNSLWHSVGSFLSIFVNNPLTLVLDLTCEEDDTGVFRFLNEIEMWSRRDVEIFVIGNREKVKPVLLHPALRNAVRPLYLGMSEDTLHDLNLGRRASNAFSGMTISQSSRAVVTEQKANALQQMSLHSKCLYCKNGQPGIQSLSWMLRPTFERLWIQPQGTELTTNLQGKSLRVVSIPFFPFTDYSLDTNQPGTTVSMKNSLDKEILQTVSSYLNFTYEVRAPVDMKLGLPTESGNWTGMMGSVQHETADFTTLTSTNPDRLRVIDHRWIVQPEKMVIVSLKPQPLPRYLIIMRPFTGEVWAYLMASIGIWAAIFWLLLKMTSNFSKIREIDFLSSLFYAWAVILEDPPSHYPPRISGQILVGCWTIVCLVISIAYRSSLVAHMAIQSYTSPINSLEDLEDKLHWSMGIERQALTGVPRSYFEKTTDPILKAVFKKGEIIDINEALLKVAKGNYFFICPKNRVSFVIATRYTDGKGRTPFHISNDYKIMTEFGWGFRFQETNNFKTRCYSKGKGMAVYVRTQYPSSHKSCYECGCHEIQVIKVCGRRGAPFMPQISKTIGRLKDSGLINYWMKTVVASRVKELRKKTETNQYPFSSSVIAQETDEAVILRMTHMVGVFFTLLLGFAISLLTFLAETQITKLFRDNLSVSNSNFE